MTTINQKEYLKKYLGIGKAPGEKKKKKKKEKIIGNKLKIIDDDADALVSQEIQDDISAANEDAPQIVAVIDERPPSLRIDEQTKSNLWTPIGETSNIATNIQSLKLNSSFKLSKQIKSSSTGKKHGMYVTKDNTKVKIEQELDISPLRSSSDYSPPRQSVKSNKDPPREVDSNSKYRKKNSAEDGYQPLKRKRNDCKIEGKEDYSPPRRRSKEDISPTLKGENRYGNNSKIVKQERSDYSPGRRMNTKESLSSKKLNMEYDNFPLRRIEESVDSSPTRRKNRESVSPLASKGSDGDNSPPRRKNNKYVSSPRRQHGEDTFSSRERSREHRSPPGRKDVEDTSPQRRTSKIDDRSPLRKKDKLDDCSPPRRKSRDQDISPPRMRVRMEETDNSPPRKNRRTDDKQRKSRWGKWSPERSPERPGNSDEKIKKTLDGKKAGLQNAKDLVKETTLLRLRENEMFKKLSAEVSGMNAATVVRRQEVKNLEEEARQKDNEKKTKEKYDRWGKGLKQVEDQNERIAEQLHEMSKPLARYADDEDLEKYLKEQERDGDPMLAYIRKKKKKESTVAGISEKPVYLGEFMPNRFGICPGYRWDGVDRSNGYETKWFQVQNSKRATQEEAFKWSTEDM